MCVSRSCHFIYLPHVIQKCGIQNNLNVSKLTVASKPISSNGIRTIRIICHLCDVFFVVTSVFKISFGLLSRHNIQQATPGKSNFQNGLKISNMKKIISTKPSPKPRLIFFICKSIAKGSPYGILIQNSPRKAVFQSPQDLGLKDIIFYLFFFYLL